ncbi:hypothetical protein B0H13DRAFT_1931615 [Mycena leptocephala]|nr:hypothetical protein B0H13DRAFT_1931615 [Mycena leptocephala]
MHSALALHPCLLKGLLRALQHQQSFILPRGAPTLTANLEELVPFEMTDEEMFSFRYLDHPAITSLVPLSGAAIIPRCKSCVLAKLSRALRNKIHSENAFRIPGSDLLDNFLAAVVSLAQKLTTRPPVVLLNGFVPRTSYIPPPPLMINETNAAEHMDKFREGMEFLLHFVEETPSPYLMILVKLFRTICLAMERFPRHNLTDAWDKGEFFPRNGFPVGFVVTPAPPYRPPSPEAGPVINSEPPGDEVDFPQDMDVDPPSFSFLCRAFSNIKVGKETQADDPKPPKGPSVGSRHIQGHEFRPITRSQGKAIANRSGQIPE